MFCQMCGAGIKDGEKFCSHCGAPAVVLQSPQEQTPVPQVQTPMPQVPNSVPQVPNSVPQKKRSSKAPLVIGIVAAIIVVIAVAAVLIWKFSGNDSNGGSSGDSGAKQHDSSKKPGQSVEKEPDSEAFAAETMPSLQEQIADVIREKGSLIGESEELYFSDSYSFERSGVLGAVISDLDGNDYEEAVIVYVTEQTANRAYPMVMADVYAETEHGVECVASQLVLVHDIGRDEVDINVYLKDTKDGLRLVGDCYEMYWHWADGGNWELNVYDCANLFFSQVADYGFTGSGPDDSDFGNHAQAAQAAGLTEVTEGLPYGPLLLQQTGVRMICNISTVIKENVNYYTDRYEATGVHYGTMYFMNLTAPDYSFDVEASEQFLELEGTRYSMAGDDSEYIFPNSDTVLLTADDIEPYKNDADMLRKARNEIYARHGRKFKDEELQAYFNSKSWYVPLIEADDFSDNMLNETEKANCRLIKEYEDKLN